MLLLRVQPRIMVIFSGFQVVGLITALLFEIFDPSSYSGTVVRLREYLPTWIVLALLIPVMTGELLNGLADIRSGAKIIACVAIFWWGSLATLMVIVEPKNVAAFAAYAIIAFFRAWAFAGTSFSSNLKGSDALVTKPI